MSAAGTTNAVLQAERLRPAESGVSMPLDLACTRGSITVLTGPSSVETTQWLETLAALQPCKGRLRILDYDSNDGSADAETRQQVAYADVAAPLLSTFNVRMNVMLPRLYHYRESRADARRRADGLLDRIGYDGPRNEPPARLTALEHIQALVARALALEPALLFIDEPFHMETVAAWRQLADRLHALAHDDNRTLLIATRNLAFAAAHASQLVFIQHDRVNVHENWQSFAAAADPAAFIDALPFALEKDIP